MPCAASAASSRSSMRGDRTDRREGRVTCCAPLGNARPKPHLTARRPMERPAAPANLARALGKRRTPGARTRATARCRTTGTAALTAGPASVARSSSCARTTVRSAGSAQSPWGRPRPPGSPSLHRGRHGGQPQGHEPPAGIARDVVGRSQIGLAGRVQPRDQRQDRVFEAGSPSSRWRRKKSAPSSHGSRRVKIQIEANHIRAWLCSQPVATSARANGRTRRSRSARAGVLPLLAQPGLCRHPVQPASDPGLIPAHSPGRISRNPFQ